MDIVSSTITQDETTEVLEEDGIWSETSFSSGDPDAEDLDAIRPTRYALNLQPQYVRHWNRRDAFREFYQNWRDAIVQSFNLDPRDPNSFRPKWSSTRNEIRITVHRDVPQPNEQPREELLGFIRFTKNTGVVELANFNAHLEVQHLCLGVSDKVHNEKLAGIHGEGFKLAALVMRRRGHGVWISSSSFYWIFRFKGVQRNRFYCRLSRPTSGTLEKHTDLYSQQLAQGPRKQLKSFISQDVMVKISTPRGSQASKVTEGDFRRWARVALDLSDPPPQDIIRTEHGDLILDPRFASHVYLKGLKVSSHAPNGKPYIFGYNFAQGEINRDRERLTHPKAEAEMLARIWEKPILDSREGVIQRYLELLLRPNSTPDVAFAETVISEQVGLKIWHALKAGKEDTFFYCERETNEDDQAEVILTTLRKQPQTIPRVLWQILRQHTHIRTPQEERIHLFVSSRQVDVPQNLFSLNVHRLLYAVLQLSPKLAHIQVKIVSGGGAGIDLLYQKDQSCLLIHEMWFDFSKSHENASCELFLLTKDRPLFHDEFSCDHIVGDLFELVISDVRRALKLKHAEASAIRRLVRERVPQMPRAVKVTVPDEAGTLEVTWRGNESSAIAENYGREIEYFVILHKMSSCAAKKDQLVHDIVPDAEDVLFSSCDCPFQIVNRETSWAVFKGLSLNDDYFPLIARVGHKTLFGVPPTSVRPRGVAVDRNTPPRQPRQSFHQRPTSPTYVVGLDNIGDGPASPGEFIHAPYPLPAAEPQATIIDELEAALKDEDYWRQWDTEELPRIGSSLFGNRLDKSQCRVQYTSSNSTFVCNRLGCEFERDTYVRLSTKQDTKSQYVTLIHEIHTGDEGCELKSPHLIVTRYSFAAAEPLLQTPNQEHCETELLLQYSGQGPMRSRYAGETIEVDDITQATIFPDDFEVVHCLRPPSDLESHRKMFCRQACCTYKKGVIFLPLSASLRPRADRQKLDGFTPNAAISVTDFTPNVLGPMFGFMQPGFYGFAGVGFDESRHSTWVKLNPCSYLFDGAPDVLLDHFQYDLLKCPDIGPSGRPRVSLVAGENANFRLSSENVKMPTKDQFLKPLNILDSASKSSFKSDFLVLLVPAAVLHESTIGRFSESVSRLRYLGHLVMINLMPLKKCGIPQERTMLAVIASPYPGLLQARRQISHFSDRLRGNGAPVTSTKTLRDVIGDLAFVNLRQGADESTGFVCSYRPGGDNEATEPPRNIYNHYTGDFPVGKPRLVDMDAETVPIFHGSSDLKHPSRKDLLSVRELARIQGFEDSILFYGSRETQRRDVLTAQPPILTAVIARIIRTAVRLSFKRQLRDPESSTEGAKRPRHEKEQTGEVRS